jgi:Transcriptional regulator, AbiEi antitoxin
MDERVIRQLLAIARSQHGLIALRQAVALGVTKDAVDVAIARGWLRRVRRGVYAVSGAPPSRWEAVMAAALAAGPDAVVSHRSAATIHGFTGLIADLPELTVPHERRLQLAGVRIHRSRNLAPGDLETRRGVRLTTPVRTVIDITGTTSEYLLGRILDDGAIRRLWTADLVAARVEQLGGRGREGTVRLRRLLDDRRGEGHPEGHLEQKVLRVLKRAKDKIPPPVVHYRVVLGGRVFDMDLAWPEHRLDGEVDGYLAHSQRSDFERDRRRANVLGAHGWQMVQWTSTMDDEEIVAVVLPYLGIT